MTNINTFQGDVFIHEYIKHTGDENNLFGFSGTDTFKIATAGSDRLTVGSDGSVTVAERLYISEYMYHSGDNDTYIRFTDNNIGLYAGGSHKIGINATNTQFYSDIYMSQYIYHYSDNNTYFGFPSNDTFKIRTSGGDGIHIDSSGRVGINQGSPTQKLDVNGYAKFGNVSIKTNGPFGSGSGGVYTGVNLNGGTGGGVVLLFVSVNSSSGNASGAWIFAIRKHYSGAGAYYPWPSYSTLFANASSTSTPTIYTDSGGVLKYTFGVNRNTKWSVYEM
jgi:hypothetical protein